MKKEFVIYKVTNKINGKLYIGKTYNFNKRKNEHLCTINDNLPFHKALKKYGVENFEWEIIDRGDSDEEIVEKEIYWIKKLNTCIHSKNSNGYNITLGGEGGVSWNSKPVVQFDLNGNYINEYVSIAHASLESGVDRHSICDCARGEYRSAGKYMWLYKKDYKGGKIQPFVPTLNQDKKRAVIQLSKDGYFLNMFESIKDACYETKTPRTGIVNCATKRTRTANGFVWIYAEEYDSLKDYKVS